MTDGQYVRIRASVFVAAVGLVTWFAIVALPRMYPAERTSVIVDMSVSAGQSVEVFVNDLTRPPLRQPVSAGTRRQYEFAGIDEDIHYLRIDPTDVPSARIRIFGVRVQGGTGLLATFGPRDLAGWQQSNLEAVPAQDGAVEWVAANNDPIVASRTAVTLPRRTSRATRELLDALAPDRLLLTVLAALWACWAIGTAASARWWTPAIVTVVAAASVWWLVPAVSALPLGVPPVDRAVGRAAFFGESLRARQLAILASSLACALSGAALAWRARRARLVATAEVEVERPTHPLAPAVLLALGAILVVGALVPDVRAVLAALQARQFSPHWDSINLTYWSYLASRGHLPFRDFWYPYSGFFLFGLAGHVGQLWRVAFEVSSLLLLVATLGRIHRWRLAVPLGTVLLLLAGDVLQLFPHLYRYLLSVNVALAFVGIDRTRRGWQWAHPAFWTACALAQFFEPVQLFYAAPLVVACLAITVAESRRDLKPVAWSSALAFGVPLGVGLAHAAWLAATGQLAGFIRFHAWLADSAAASAFPTDVAAFAHLPEAPPFLVMVIAAALVGAGLAERLGRGGNRTVAEALLALGLVATMGLQKFAVRPDERALLFIVTIAIPMAVTLRRHTTVVDRLVAGLAVGAFAAAFSASTTIPRLAAQVTGAPARLGNTLVALDDPAALQAAARASFSEVHFSAFQDERAVVQHLRGLNGGRAPEMFALTDQATFYVLTGQPPVYHSNMYNASPIYEQEQVVGWLRARQVPVVVIDRTALGFDGFQKAVRVPLVFDYVIAEYVPLARIGKYDVLRRRASGDALPLAYWRDVLGDHVFFGHLPALSASASRPPCQAGAAGAGCASFAEVRLAVAPPASFMLRLPVGVGTSTFSIYLKAVPGVTRYEVDLDRAWFWTAARRAGAEPALGAVEPATGVSVVLVPRLRDKDVLY